MSVKWEERCLLLSSLTKAMPPRVFMKSWPLSGYSYLREPVIGWEYAAALPARGSGRTWAAPLGVSNLAESTSNQHNKHKAS